MSFTDEEVRQMHQNCNNLFPPSRRRLQSIEAYYPRRLLPLRWLEVGQRFWLEGKLTVEVQKIGADLCLVLISSTTRNLVCDGEKPMFVKVPYIANQVCPKGLKTKEGQVLWDCLMSSRHEEDSGR